MPTPDTAFAESMIRRFFPSEDSVSLHPFGSGHINDTFLATLGDGRAFVLQRLSPVAFREPEKVMDNVIGVTRHLRIQAAKRGGDPERETLHFVRNPEGRYYELDGEGGLWRVYRCVENAVSYELPESTGIFREAGRAFGRFQTSLKDYPAATLHETIPHFHDTPDRIRQLRRAAEADRAGRAVSVREELDFALSRSDRASALVNAGLPLRVTHNDTKLNNVLIDTATGKGLCVIDLDTVMPGLAAYDFGDALRFGANSAMEDERDLSRVRFNMEMYRAWCEGYLGEAAAIMSDAEIRSLPLGAWMMTYECGSRFLTDYLDGDRYFHIAFPDHNLVRARCQYALLRDIEAKWDELMKITEAWCGKNKGAEEQ